MGYPLRYRNAGLQNAVPKAQGRSPRGGQVLQFPRERRFPRGGRFGAPTRLPGRANFGLRAPYAPATVRPPPSVAGSIGRGLLIGAAFDLGWWVLNEDFSVPLEKAAIMGAGWNRVCGPFPYPGPPYLRKVRYQFFGANNPTCDVPLGGQAITPALETPTVSTSAAIFYYGPNASNRFYGFEQWDYPGGNGNVALRNIAYSMPVVTGPLRGNGRKLELLRMRLPPRCEFHPFILQNQFFRKRLAVAGLRRYRALDRIGTLLFIHLRPMARGLDWYLLALRRCGTAPQGLANASARWNTEQKQACLW